jgi:ribosomal protein S1
VEAEFADPAHFGEGRTGLDELQEGQVLTGTITDLWLYHGLEVDIGAQYDGLIPMQEEEWADMAALVKPGAEIQVC